jgi:hypothetical protein
LPLGGRGARGHNDRTMRTPSERITDEVTSWPGVEAGYGRRGEYGFRIGNQEVGHLHGDHAAHFFFGKELGPKLKEQGRVVDHPVFPGKPGPAARRIEDEADVDDVIELMRLNYDRVRARGRGTRATNDRAAPAADPLQHG